VQDHARQIAPLAPAYDSNAKWQPGLRAAAFTSMGCAIRDRSARKKALERADCDGLIDLAAAACCLAGVSAYASADAGHGIGVARYPIGFFKFTLRNELNIAAGVGVRGTGHHARENWCSANPCQPFVDEAFLHGPFPSVKNFGRQSSTLPLADYLLSAKSADVSPATLTGFDLLFAPSCHAVTV